MNRLILAVALVTFASCRTAVDDTAAATVPGSTDTTMSDQFVWLEEIDDPRALAWVEQQNVRTRRELASTPEFQRSYDQILSALNSSSRVPQLTYRNNALYDFRRSETNPRGVYRRTTLSELRGGSPSWQTVLDIDALSREEGKQWVFKGMQCLPPANRRCLVSLSPGGGDAVEIREFDADTLRFVKDGFFVPEAKSRVAWLDEDSLLIATDFGAGSLTESGYPRSVRLWKRGSSLAGAAPVYEASPESVSAGVSVLRTTKGDIVVISDSKTFWTNDYYQYVDGRLEKLRLPESAVLEGGIDGRLVIRLIDDWSVGNEHFPGGSIVLADPARLRGGQGGVELLVAPTESEVIEGVDVLDREILITALDNVRGRLYRFSPAAAGWKREAITFPENGAIGVMTTRDDTGDALVQYESFVSPPTLYHVAPGSTSPARILAQDATFDGTSYDVTQRWATSADGTRIPYFVVARRGVAMNGKNPVHIFSYGGFRNSLTPSYSGSYEALYGAYGKAWLDRGGIFVLANIRGGGEFGPEWHSSVLKKNHFRIFEDFEAVARDLVKEGYTSHDRIGIEGRSNGGLLVLATMVRHPGLYGAIVAGVPLSDMQRYHRMLAGASWMAEYGDPDVPEEWAYISEYSPYQNFSASADYPPLFVYTSTRDDRVHPGHARKTVAKLQAQGHPVWYYENTEGGHGGSSTNEQLAYRVALAYAHLWKHLGD